MPGGPALHTHTYTHTNTPLTTNLERAKATTTSLVDRPSAPPLTVHCAVANTGPVAGSEVVQFYFEPDRHVVVASWLTLPLIGGDPTLF